MVGVDDVGKGSGATTAFVGRCARKSHSRPLAMPKVSSQVDGARRCKKSVLGEGLARRSTFVRHIRIQLGVCAHPCFLTQSVERGIIRKEVQQQRCLRILGLQQLNQILGPSPEKRFAYFSRFGYSMRSCRFLAVCFATYLPLLCALPVAASTLSMCTSLSGASSCAGHAGRCLP